MKHTLAAALVSCAVGCSLSCGGSSAPPPSATPEPVGEVADAEPDEGAADEDEAAATAKAAPSDDDEADEPEYARGKWVRFELFSPAPAKAAAFYAALFGWTTTAGDGGGYDVANGERAIARIVQYDAGRGVPQGWLGWVSVEDVDDTVRDIAANEGRVLEPAVDDDRGRSAIAVGPTGATFGVIKARAGDTDAAPDVGDWYWNQLWTTDLDDALGFYEVVGGYTSVDVAYGKLSYKVLEDDGVPRAVIRYAPKGEASRWVPFVAVSDVAATTAAAKKLGAKLVTEPREVAGMGTVAVYATPAGGVIGVIAPAAAAGEADDDEGDGDDDE